MDGPECPELRLVNLMRRYINVVSKQREIDLLKDIVSFMLHVEQQQTFVAAPGGRFRGFIDVDELSAVHMSESEFIYRTEDERRDYDVRQRESEREERERRSERSQYALD